MTNEQVNRVISEYMGGELCLSDDTGNAVIGYEPYTYFEMDCYKNSHNLFTNSLDALVPVWERLKVVASFSHTSEYEHNEPTLPVIGNFRCHISERGYVDNYHGDGYTIQEASAHATAKAILALKEK